MSDLSDVLPDRDIRIVRTGRDPASQIWSAAILCFVILGLCAWQVPILKRDYAISQDYRVLPAGWVEGECHTAVLVFTVCYATVNVNRLGTVKTHRVATLYVTADFGDDDILVDIVYGAGDVGRLTISPAIENIWNRILTFGFLVAIFALLVLVYLRDFGRASRMERLTRRPLPLRLVTVGLSDGSSRPKLKSYLKYEYFDDAGERHTGESIFKSGEKPFALKEGGFLAVLPAGIDLPFVLDARLRRLDLTKKERRKVQDAFPSPPFSIRSFLRRLFRLA